LAQEEITKLCSFASFGAKAQAYELASTNYMDLEVSRWMKKRKCRIHFFLGRVAEKSSSFERQQGLQGSVLHKEAESLLGP
jgi:hypothetical protein